MFSDVLDDARAAVRSAIISANRAGVCCNYGRACVRSYILTVITTDVLTAAGVDTRWEQWTAARLDPAIISLLP